MISAKRITKCYLNSYGHSLVELYYAKPLNNHETNPSNNLHCSRTQVGSAEADPYTETMEAVEATVDSGYARLE